MKTFLDCGEFEELYATSIKDPDFFWGTLAKQFLQWDKLFEKVVDCNMEKGDIKWFTGGKLNVSGNTKARHVIYMKNYTEFDIRQLYAPVNV